MPDNRARFHFDNVYGDKRTVGSYDLYQVGDLYCEPGYIGDRHIQRVHELTYVVSGSGEMLVGNEKYAMRPGMLFFSKLGEAHAIYTSSERLRFFYIGFDFSSAMSDDAAKLHDFLENDCQTPAVKAESLGDAFIRMFSEVDSDDAPGRLLFESAVQEVISLACRFLSQSDVRSYHMSDTRVVDEQLVYRIINYLDSNSCRIGALSDLTKEFGYSYTHLAKKFSEITGESLHAYHTRHRFERAQEYLRRGETVTKTAELCGYDSIHAFSRAFKRVVGISPGEYRHKYN